MRYRQKVRHRTLTPALLVQVQLPQLKTSFGGKNGRFFKKVLREDLRVIVGKKHYKDFFYNASSACSLERRKSYNEMDPRP